MRQNPTSRTHYFPRLVQALPLKVEGHEKFEDNKGGLRRRKSKKNRQHNGEKKKDERINNDLQNITPKTTDHVTRTPLNTGGELE